MTQVDVAKRAGTTRSTVSRVFNGDKRISAATTEKVLQSARELGYVHPQLSKENKQITIFGYDGGNTSELTNGFLFMETLRGISDFCRTAGYHVNMISNKFEDEAKLVSEFKAIIDTSNSAGYIFPSVLPINENLISPFFEAESPLVLVNRYLHDFDIDCVVNDDLWVGRKAADTFIEHGHRNVGFIGCFLDRSAMYDRFSGFRNVMLDNEVDISNNCSFHRYLTIQEGYLGMTRLLERNKDLTAVFCCNDESAFGAISAATDLGYNVPEDISIIGHDDLVSGLNDTLCLSTFRYNFYAAGYIAAELLIAKIEKPDITPRKIVVRPEFIPGNSVNHVKKPSLAQ